MRGQKIGKDKKRKERDEKEARVFDYLLFLLGYYKTGKKIPPLLTEKIDEYKKICSMDTLYRALVEEEANIRKAFKYKTFASETGKINYLFGIVGNRLNELIEEEKWYEQMNAKTAAFDGIPADLEIGNDWTPEEFRERFKVRDLSEYEYIWK